MNQPESNCTLGTARGAAPLRDATDLELALYVASAGSVTAAALANALHVSTTTASRRLEQMQDAGLVQELRGSWQALHTRDRNKRAWSKQRQDLLTT